MIEILLLLFKIIGIVLLSLLILFLVLVGAVLFVPIRYRINVKKDSVIYAESKISWLFHSVSIRLRYEKELFFKICILGIPIYDNTRIKKEKKKKEKRKKERLTLEEKNKEEVQEIQKEEKNKIKKEMSKQPNIEQKIETQKKQKKKEKNKFFFKDKIKRAVKKLKYFFGNIYYYIELCQREESKQVFLLCKKSLLKIFNWIKPKKIQIYLHIGTNDPATTGQILAWYSMLYPLIGKNIVIEPEFEMLILEGNAYAKGSMRFIVLACIAWKIFFDKNIRIVISLFRKEE